MLQLEPRSGRAVLRPPHHGGRQAGITTVAPVYFAHGVHLSRFGSWWGVPGAGRFDFSRWQSHVAAQDHPGLPNSELCRSLSEWALVYNDRSVLENRSAALAFSILRMEGHNVMQGFSAEQFAQFRAWFIDIVLVTDITEAKRVEGAMDAWTRVAPTFDPAAGDDAIALCRIVMLAADVGSVCRPMDQLLVWSRRLMTEICVWNATMTPAVFASNQSKFLKLHGLKTYNALALLPALEPLKRLTEENVATWEAMSVADREAALTSDAAAPPQP